MSAPKILVVDDEPQVRRVMRATLSTRGYQVNDARNGPEALEKLRDDAPDLILLDMNLPGMGGLEVCRAMRAGSDVPIIIISIRNSERDKVEALDAGADDYVTKPFPMEELLARIRANMRRRPSAAEAGLSLLVLGDVEIDFDARQVKTKGKSVHLTPKEYDVLRYMVLHAGKALAHRELLQAVWGPDYGEEVEYLRVVVNQLRKKIEPDPARPRYLVTEPWVGYRLVQAENVLRKS